MISLRKTGRGGLLTLVLCNEEGWEGLGRGGDEMGEVVFCVKEVGNPGTSPDFQSLKSLLEPTPVNVHCHQLGAKVASSMSSSSSLPSICSFIFRGAKTCVSNLFVLEADVECWVFNVPEIHCPLFKHLRGNWLIPRGASRSNAPTMFGQATDCTSTLDI